MLPPGRQSRRAKAGEVPTNRSPCVRPDPVPRTGRPCRPRGVGGACCAAPPQRRRRHECPTATPVAAHPRLRSTKNINTGNTRPHRMTPASIPNTKRTTCGMLESEGQTIRATTPRTTARTGDPRPKTSRHVFGTGGSSVIIHLRSRYPRQATKRIRRTASRWQELSVILRAAARPPPA